MANINLIATCIDLSNNFGYGNHIDNIFLKSVIYITLTKEF